MNCFEPGQYLLTKIRQTKVWDLGRSTQQPLCIKLDESENHQEALRLTFPFRFILTISLKRKKRRKEIKASFMHNRKKTVFHTIKLKYCSFSIGNSMICSDIWHKYHE